MLNRDLMDPAPQTSEFDASLFFSCVVNWMSLGCELLSTWIHHLGLSEIITEGVFFSIFSIKGRVRRAGERLWMFELNRKTHTLLWTHNTPKLQRSGVHPETIHTVLHGVEVNTRSHSWCKDKSYNIKCHQTNDMNCTQTWCVRLFLQNISDRGEEHGLVAKITRELSYIAF